jgi:hypothetical protein
MVKTWLEGNGVNLKVINGKLPCNLILQDFVQNGEEDPILDAGSLDESFVTSSGFRSDFSLSIAEGTSMSSNTSSLLGTYLISRQAGIPTWKISTPAFSISVSDPQRVVVPDTQEYTAFQVTSFVCRINNRLVPTNVA